MPGIDDIMSRLREIDERIGQVRHEAEAAIAGLESDRRQIARELANELKAAGLAPALLAEVARPKSSRRRRRNTQYQLVWKKDKSPVLDAAGRPFVYQNRMNKIRNARARTAIGGKWAQIALLDCNTGDLLPDVIGDSED